MQKILLTVTTKSYHYSCSLLLLKIPAAREKQADGKIFAGVEISAPDEIPAAIEKPAEPERQAACLLFRLGGISSC
jgi:hypothetical protein